ncbi:hypothetical protein RHMOL_Rhmol09G0270100 [Rhododendron molle]|uniref:Uncharacterized protein n=1 Tax=Rhododendron molle TaxID=49168 RepID=A0ACC0MJ55_RHOML|nr:hypothetical protein RHMOL_Rhmol09G0270100 [Rhododendron molle]
MAMEKKNKRKIRAPDGNYNSSGDGDGEDGVFSAAPVLPHDLVAAEVLTRLPAKSLMRFKCVSKLWLSTILDPGFCESHRDRPGPFGCTGLLIVSPDEEQHKGLRFFLANPSRRVVLPLTLDEPLSPHFRDVFDLLHHQLTLSTREYDGVTEVDDEIGNLVCLYTANRVWLCSVSTGEIIELPPPPPSPSPENGAAICFKYYLGYDCHIKRFKVLRVCSIQGAFFLRLQYEILTLGGEEYEASWRKLNGRTSMQIIGGSNDNSVYINGARYWWHDSGCLLVRFCFEDEEFLRIGLPPGFPKLGGSLHEFRGLVALVTGVTDRKLHMWVLCRNCDNEGVWSERTLRIPYAFADRGCCFLGNLHTGLMLMTGTTIEQEDEQQQGQRQPEEEEVYNSKSPLKATTPIYSYDLLFGKFDEFVIGNPLSSTSLVGKDTSKLRIYSYVEDIRPLNLFISNPFGD